MMVKQLGATVSEKSGTAVFSGVLPRRWKDIDHRGGTTVESIEGRPEYLDRFIPGISNGAAAFEHRLEIASDDDSFAFYSEHPPDLTRLVRVHYDHEIGLASVCLGEGSRAIPRKVEATLGAELYGDRWNRTIAAGKARRRHGYVREAALQYGLEVWTPTDISVTHNQNSARAARFRQLLTRREMPTGMNEAIVQTADRTVDTLQRATWREWAGGHGVCGISNRVGYVGDVHDA